MHQGNTVLYLYVYSGSERNICITHLGINTVLYRDTIEFKQFLYVTFNNQSIKFQLQFHSKK